MQCPRSDIIKHLTFLIYIYYIIYTHNPNPGINVIYKINLIQNFVVQL